MDEPRLLVLRIWSQDRRFTALVRELGPEARHRFDDPRALMRFLLGRGCGQGPRDTAAAPGRVPFTEEPR